MFLDKESCFRTQLNITIGLFIRIRTARVSCLSPQFYPTWPAHASRRTVPNRWGQESDRKFRARDPLANDDHFMIQQRRQSHHGFASLEGELWLSAPDQQADLFVLEPGRY